MEESQIRDTNKSHRILIADDEPWFVQGLRDALELEGYKVDNARTGSETLALVRSGDTRPAVLILDIMMSPGDLHGTHEKGTRTGLVVLEVIRKDLGISERKLPIICLTIVEDNGLRKRIQQLGADYYSKKDFKVPELLHRISKVINKP